MRIANVLAGFSLAEADVLRKAVGKKDAELVDRSSARFVERAVAQGHPQKVMAEIGGPDRDLRPLRLQQVALGRLLDPVVPDRVAQGALPRRVHGGTAVVGNRQHRQGGAVHQRGARARAGDPAAGRERVGIQVHGGGRPADPLRPGRGAERGRGRDRVDHRRARRAAVHVAVRPRRAHRPPALQQAGGRIADRRRRLRLARRPPQAAAARRSKRRSARPSSASRSATRARSRCSAKRPRRRPARRLRCPTCRPWTEAERLAREKEVHRLLHFRSPAGALPQRGGAVRRRAPRRRCTSGASTRSRIAAVVTAVKRQISKKTGQGIRAARARGLPRHGGGDRLPRRVGQAQPDRSCPTRALLLTGGYSDRDRGEDRAPFIVEAAQPLAELKASGALALSLRWALPTAPPPETLRARRGALHQRTRARRRSILNGATATGSRCGSRSPSACGWRRRRSRARPA